MRVEVADVLLSRLDDVCQLTLDKTSAVRAEMDDEEQLLGAADEDTPIERERRF